MKEKKIRHLYNPETGRTLCGLLQTENVETTVAVSRMTCKRCETIISPSD